MKNVSPELLWVSLDEEELNKNDSFSESSESSDDSDYRVNPPVDKIDGSMILSNNTAPVHHNIMEGEGSNKCIPFHIDVSFDNNIPHTNKQSSSADKQQAKQKKAGITI